MGTTQTNVQGTVPGDTVSYVISNVSVGTIMTDDLFKDLGVKINQERVRRGSSANAAIKDLADFTGTIQYAEMEKLRTSLQVQGPVNPIYKLANNQNTQSARATSAFAGDPGSISAGGSWSGKPKITAALFNTIIQGLRNQGAECVCNCNYCTCNCNYCTCNCNFSCTCNCNYSDVTTKNNIVYM
jgi:hypothetical protein